MALFTAENAAEMARRAAEAKNAAKEITKLGKLTPDLEQQFAESHRKLRLLRVRKQQEKVDRMIQDETDPAKIDRLASAAIRLNEQERQLSNRSLPPTLKANAVRTKTRAVDLDSPEPASSVVHTPSNSVPIQAELTQDTQVSQPIEPQPDAPSPPVV